MGKRSGQVRPSCLTLEPFGEVVSFAPVRLFFILSGYVLDKLCDLFVRPIEFSEILKNLLNVFIIQCRHFVHTFHLPFWLLAFHPKDI